MTTDVDSAAADHAVIGKAGNMNSVTLKYTNDPNDNSNYTTNLGVTEADTAYVYCYKLVMDKIQTGSPTTKLADAKFRLYRSTGSDFLYAKVVNGNLIGWTTLEDKPADSASQDDKDAYAQSVLTTDSNGAFTVNGISSGTYYLEEIDPPTTYNKLEDDIPVTVTASANQVSGVLDSLTATATHGGQANAEVNSGMITVTVGNTKGNTLPSTGGMGTTVLYLAGSAMMVGAAAILLAKKRFAQG